MQSKIKNLKFIISFCVVLTSFLVKGQNPVVVDEIIAKVDNYIILKSELEKTYLDAISNGADPTDLKCLILASVVRDKLMVAKADIDSVIVTDEEVEMNLSRRIDMILSQYNGSEEMIMQYYGKTLEDIRLELSEAIREQMVVEKMQQEITMGINVTPSETRRFFKRIPTDSLPFYDMEVEVAEISRKVTPGPEEKQKIVDALIELRKRAVNGEDFAELAKKYSQGPSAPQGGDLGNTKRGAMVPEFEAGALALRPGEVSMPIETQFGFHLIKLEERRGNEYRARHILMRPIPSEKDFQKTRDYLDSLRLLVVNDSITFEKAAIEFSEDEMTKGSGGYFMDASGASRISIRDIDPEVYFAIDTMKVGTISRPLDYQLADGAHASRILFYKTTRDPHRANLEEDWQKIMQAALIEKKNKKLIEWFNGARDDVFISIDEEYDQCRIIN